MLTGEIVEDGDEEYVEVEAYVAGEDDNDEVVCAEVCLDTKDREAALVYARVMRPLRLTSMTAGASMADLARAARALEGVAE